MRSYQGVLVSGILKDGVTQKAALESKKAVCVKLYNNFGADTLEINEHGKSYAVQVKQGEVFTLCLQKGKTEITAK